MLPIQFEYVSESFDKQKYHVTIIGQYKHYYTGKTLYRIRREGKYGWFGEEFCDEETIRRWLDARVKE